MKNPKSQQASFIDVDYYCEQLVPKNIFYRKFREKLHGLIIDEMFSELYCGNNGRPPISPSLLAKAMLIQYHMNLSDRELERACMFDIEVKFALGLRIDERPFDHSSLGDFRDRLLKSRKEKEIFDQILKQLIDDKLISKEEVQRVDATHVLADIAIPNMVGMVKKASFEILKLLNKNNSEIEKEVLRNISAEEYTSIKINDDGAGRFDLNKRAECLVKYVNEAQYILKSTDHLKEDARYKEPIEVLRTILRENIETTEDGEPREIDSAKKPTNRIVSPIDVDARAGAKSKIKKFIGYKTSISQEIKNRFITNVDVMAGNINDGKATVKLFEELKRSLDIVPVKVIGDSAYGDGIIRQQMSDLGCQIVSPFKDKNPRTKAVLPKSDFKIDRTNNTLTCPRGVIAKPHFYDSAKSSMNFHFPMSACNRCDLQSKCTKAKEGRRTVRIYDWQGLIMESETYNRTDEFKNDMKLRQAIEGKFAEMKRLHGMTRTRYRGLKKVRLQCAFTAAIVNLKRWINIEYAAI